MWDTIKLIIKLVGLGLGAWGILVFIGLLLAAHYHQIIIPWIYDWEFPIEITIYVIAFVCAIVGFILVAKEGR